MLQAESAEIGTLQQCPRDGRRIVPADPPPADLVVQPQPVETDRALCRLRDETDLLIER